MWWQKIKSLLFGQKEKEENQKKESRFDVKFRSLRTHGERGARSMGWLLMMLVLIGLLFWYLSQM